MKKRTAKNIADANHRQKVLLCWIDAGRNKIEKIDRDIREHRERKRGMVDAVTMWTSELEEIAIWLSKRTK
jgi:hypothetical protein